MFSSWHVRRISLNSCVRCSTSKKVVIISRKFGFTYVPVSWWLWQALRKRKKERNELIIFVSLFVPLYSITEEEKRRRWPTCIYTKRSQRPSHKFCAQQAVRPTSRTHWLFGARNRPRFTFFHFRCWLLKLILYNRHYLTKKNSIVRHTDNYFLYNVYFYKGFSAIRKISTDSFINKSQGLTQ